MAKTVFDDTPPLGTILTAAFLNAMQNHRHTGADADGSCPIDYAVAAGSGNAYEVTLVPALGAYVQGMAIAFKANHTNTGSATININSLGVKTMKKNYDQNLAAGDIKSGQIVVGHYDGTNFQIIALPGSSFFYAVDNGAANAYVAAYSPAITAHVNGLPLQFKASNVNTGASTLVVNSLAAVAIKRLDGTALQAGDIPAGAIVTVTYDGTNYQLQTATPYASHISAVSGTRNLAANSGDVSYTGAGFTPKMVLIFCGPDDSTYGSIGGGNVATQLGMQIYNGEAHAGYVVYSQIGFNGAKAALKSLDSDGCTLTWTKGTAVNKTADMLFLFFR